MTCRDASMVSSVRFSTEIAALSAWPTFALILSSCANSFYANRRLSGEVILDGDWYAYDSSETLSSSGRRCEQDFSVGYFNSSFSR